MTAIHVTKKSTSKSENSYDVFISYAWADNKNKFVNNLYKALKDAGLEVWLDHKELPPAADFVEEFLRGVQKSDNFVPILTPNYLNSTNCGKELQSAIENKKRIVPIIREAIDFKQLPQEIERVLAIQFEATVDFNKALGELLEAVNTDPKYVRAHTLLHRRAWEWQERGEITVRLYGVPT
ncbi:MAG TPA: toll/interleukin-1 receptor domain-containing protein [Phototrophicaceae bacterium]|nr:toll/interleukin-1 receptor domain-containing protein [Phototrophicaceae bacterium]